MSSLVIAFPSARSAAVLVAGIPAAARALLQAVRETDAPFTSCIFITPDLWEPGSFCRAEWARLTPGITCSVAAEAPNLPDATAPVHNGTTLVLHAASLSPEQILRDADEKQQLRALRLAGRSILAATTKPGDGVVSRYFNRPISQAISGRLLAIAGITPNHASVGTALLGIMMAASLLLGGPSGLIAGALLFQAASIFDGVDGEIARATFRTSAKGAMIDSLIDAVTNLAFIGGVTANLALAGEGAAAIAGASGLAMLATGLLAIGLRSARQGGPFTFDVIKHHARRKPSFLMQCLIWLTMRDFIAALACVLILAGFARYALAGFAVGAALWLMYTLSVLVRTRAVPVSS